MLKSPPKWPKTETRRQIDGLVLQAASEHLVRLAAAEEYMREWNAMFGPVPAELLEQINQEWTGQ